MMKDQKSYKEMLTFAKRTLMPITTKSTNCYVVLRLQSIQTKSRYTSSANNAGETVSEMRISEIIFSI